MPLKHCWRCAGFVNLIAGFNSSKGLQASVYRYGRGADCKSVVLTGWVSSILTACTNLKKNMPYKDKSKQRDYQRRWIQDRRTQFLRDHMCCLCGKSSKLELDHIDPKQKVSHRIWSWSAKKRVSEISKCQILCEACHMAKTRRDLSLMLTKPIRHGTITGYRRKGCRCKKCSTEEARYKRYRRSINKKK